MGHHHHHEHNDTDNLRLAFYLNLVFALIELVGGLLTNSVAILSDALHDLGDSASLALAWVLNRVSEQEGDEQYTYGYRRFSLLGAFINAVILIGGSIFVLSEAIPRLTDPEATSAPGMIVLALGGVAANGYAAYRLRGGSTENMQVIGWHLMEDVLGWVAVLVVGVVLLFVDAPILDPILSILITLYILYNVLGNLRGTVRLFLQARPTGVDMDALEANLRAINGVESLHHTHVWSLDGEHNVLTTHLVVPAETASDTVRRIRHESYERISDLNLEHITIAVEYADEDCPMQ